jgi:hypothetical protein
MVNNSTVGTEYQQAIAENYEFSNSQHTPLDYVTTAYIIEHTTFIQYVSCI